jgi:hypothetical protein
MRTGGSVQLSTIPTGSAPARLMKPIRAELLRAPTGPRFLYGGHNSLDQDVEESEAFARKTVLNDGAIITYHARGPNWFVISGTQGDKTFYLRELVSDRESDIHVALRLNIRHC